ncbi:hypothetical protein Tco_0830265 [Tanacetum coccineum]
MVSSSNVVITGHSSPINTETTQSPLLPEDHSIHAPFKSVKNQESEKSSKGVIKAKRNRLKWINQGRSTKRGDLFLFAFGSVNLSRKLMTKVQRTRDSRKGNPASKQHQLSPHLDGRSLTQVKAGVGLFDVGNDSDMEDTDQRPPFPRCRPLVKFEQEKKKLCKDDLVGRIQTLFKRGFHKNRSIFNSKMDELPYAVMIRLTEIWIIADRCQRAKKIALSISKLKAAPVTRILISKNTMNLDREALSQSQMRFLSVNSVKVFRKIRITIPMRVNSNDVVNPRVQDLRKGFLKFHPNDFRSFPTQFHRNSSNHLAKTDKTVFTQRCQHVDKKPGVGICGGLQLGLKVIQTKINIERPIWGCSRLLLQRRLFDLVPIRGWRLGSGLRDDKRRSTITNDSSHKLEGSTQGPTLLVRVEVLRPHKGVRASANSDVMYSFTSAQDGDPLQDDLRLCLGDDLKKAQNHSQRQA